MSEGRPVAAIFLLDGDFALLQHRDNKPGLPHANLWVPPGGHCEAGEVMAACAQREFREETGYDCDELYWLDELEDRVEGFPPYRLTVYWAVYDGLQRITCREGQAMAFKERRHIESQAIPQYLLDLWDRALTARDERTREPLRIVDLVRKER